MQGSFKFEKLCKSCNTMKPLGDFSVSKKAKDGRQSKCKPCFKEYQQAHRYGISQKQYHALLEHHQGKCGVCHKEKPLVVDHNHDTGRVRGFLCSQCNAALGLLNDSIDNLRSAVGYLQHDRCGNNQASDEE